MIDTFTPSPAPAAPQRHSHRDHRHHRPHQGGRATRGGRWVLALFVALIALGVGPASHARAETAPSESQEPAEKKPKPKLKGVPQGTGLPVPRFVTLRAAEVNARTGPGRGYPIEWVFTRKEMPVEVTAEFDTWRRIRDWEGSQGWVHQSMLSGNRGVLIAGNVRTLHAKPADNAPVVARAEPGVLGKLSKCEGDWCQVNLDGHKGWLRRGDVWGVYPSEKFE